MKQSGSTGKHEFPQTTALQEIDIDMDQEKRLAEFLFEIGMLSLTKRSGYQFLGSGGQSVAEHSHRAAAVGYILAIQCGADPLKVLLMLLFHDLHEARTGDFNYVNKIYNTADSERAMNDALAGTGLEDILMASWREFEEGGTLEARLARDADQLDLIIDLKREMDLGNPYAGKWMQSALARLKTEQAASLAQAIMGTDHTDWWRRGRPDSLWINGHE